MTERSLPDHFLGFSRRAGPPGVRNHVLILSLSGLELAAAQAVHRMLPRSVLIGTSYGRGQIGEDRRFQRHMMTALATHPNVGACVVLGPDDGMVEDVGAALDRAGRPWAGHSLQSTHEDRFALVDRAARDVTRLLREVSRQHRTRQPLESLAVAIECGHSDATSGIAANPLAGAAVKQLVSLGGRALFSETLEWTGTGDILARRAADPSVGQAIRDALRRRHELALAAGHDPQANNPGPQNHDGGLTTLEEKSLGAIAKGGDQPIAGLLEAGERLPDRPGLYLMDTPCLSPESITSMIASGAQLVLFTTGQGNPYGSALAPTIKISAHGDTVTALPHQIDFDASAILRGEAVPLGLADLLLRTMVDVASGTLTWSEAAGEATESISRLGPSI
jgi:altronate dehydratase large subunit